MGRRCCAGPCTRRRAVRRARPAPTTPTTRSWPPGWARSAPPYRSRASSPGAATTGCERWATRRWRRPTADHRVTVRCCALADQPTPVTDACAASSRKGTAAGCAGRPDLDCSGRTRTTLTGRSVPITHHVAGPTGGPCTQESLGDRERAAPADHSPSIQAREANDQLIPTDETSARLRRRPPATERATVLVGVKVVRPAGRSTLTPTAVRRLCAAAGRRRRLVGFETPLFETPLTDGAVTGKCPPPWSGRPGWPRRRSRGAGCLLV